MFLDSAVQGLRYTTSPSNVSGTTNADGQFSYNAGDTVTFALGDLVLGTVSAQDTVTPLTVAQALVAANPSGDVETITVNVLAFLQSLDSDGNADNGITIASSVGGAMASNAINFVADASSFTSALTSLVTSVEGAAGVDLTVVSREQARDHFVEQSPTLVAGTYVWANEQGVAVTQRTRTLTLFENGTYLYGGHDDDPNCNDTGNYEDADGNGVEMGTFDFNPLTRALTFAKTFETNGSCGVETAAEEHFTLTIDGNVLEIQTESELTYWVPVPATSNDLGGSWGLPVALLADRPFVVSFFPTAAGSGRYLIVDAMLEEPDASDDTSSGIEEGCYTLSSGGALTVDLDPATCPGAIDTNDTAGLSHPHDPLVAQVDGHGRLRINEGPIGADGTTDFIRLPLQPYGDVDRVGTWYLELDGVTPQEDPNLAIVSLFADGDYLFGARHDDAQCDDSSLPDQDENGNGAEFGQLEAPQNALHGVVAATASTDTNGSCGLNDANLATPQRFMLVRSQVDDAMLLFAGDEAMSLAFKRVPSVADGLIGAWSYDATPADHPHVAVFLPGGVLFEVSSAAGSEAGLWRSTYELNEAGDELTLTWGGALCLDTMGYDDCQNPGEEVLNVERSGSAATIGEYSYTKISAP